MSSVSATLLAYQPGDRMQIEYRTYEVRQAREGGMGVVYLLENLASAHSPAFPKHLAAKMFKAEIPLKQIVNELNIWLDLRHKNILLIGPVVV